jgi:hypothetical protein
VGRARHEPVSGADGNTVRDVGLSEASGSGSRSRDGPGLPARRLISQRMTVTATASTVAMAIVTNPPAIHCVALTASPEPDGPAFCCWSRPAASAPTM